MVSILSKLPFPPVDQILFINRIAKVCLAVVTLLTFRLNTWKVHISPKGHRVHFLQQNPPEELSFLRPKVCGIIAGCWCRGVVVVFFLLLLVCFALANKNTYCTTSKRNFGRWASYSDLRWCYVNWRDCGCGVCSSHVWFELMTPNCAKLGKAKFWARVMLNVNRAVGAQRKCWEWWEWIVLWRSHQRIECCQSASAGDRRSLSLGAVGQQVFEIHRVAKRLRVITTTQIGMCAWPMLWKRNNAKLKLWKSGRRTLFRYVPSRNQQNHPKSCTEQIVMQTESDCWRTI